MDRYPGIGLCGDRVRGQYRFYNAYLPEIAEPQDQDRVSAKGFALGYIGSSLLLIFSLSMVLFPDAYGGIEKGTAIRLAFLLVGVWWFGFAQITFTDYPTTFMEDPAAGIICSTVIRNYEKYGTNYDIRPGYVHF